MPGREVDDQVRTEDIDVHETVDDLGAHLSARQQFLGLLVDFQHCRGVRRGSGRLHVDAATALRRMPSVKGIRE